MKLLSSLQWKPKIWKNHSLVYRSQKKPTIFQLTNIHITTDINHNFGNNQAIYSHKIQLRMKCRVYWPWSDFCMRMWRILHNGRWFSRWIHKYFHSISANWSNIIEKYVALSCACIRWCSWRSIIALMDIRTYISVMSAIDTAKSILMFVNYRKSRNTFWINSNLWNQEFQ